MEKRCELSPGRSPHFRPLQRANPGFGCCDDFISLKQSIHSLIATLGRRTIPTWPCQAIHTAMVIGLYRLLRPLYSSFVKYGDSIYSLGQVAGEVDADFVFVSQACLYKRSPSADFFQFPLLPIPRPLHIDLENPQFLP